MRTASFAALGLLLALGLVATASAVTVNGLLDPGEWDGRLIDDATNDDHGAGDMRRWGWQIDHDVAGGPVFYAAFEMWDTIQTGPNTGSPHPTLDQYEATDYPVPTWPPTPAGMFPGIWFNVDPNAAVPTGVDAGNCDFNRADGTRTCDVNVEMGSDNGVIINPPANPSTGTPNPASLNFWGTNGTIGEDFGSLFWNCSTGSFYYSGYVIEIGVPLSAVKTAASLASTGAVADPVTWRIGIRFDCNGHPEVGTDYIADLNGARANEDTVWIFVARPGDANGDGVVDDEDASILGANWMSTGAGTPGDFNGDGIVNDKDAAILAAHWGDGLSAEESVPEPATLCLLVMGVLVLAGRRFLKR